MSKRENVFVVYAERDEYSYHETRILFACESGDAAAAAVHDLRMIVTITKSLGRKTIEGILVGHTSLPGDLFGGDWSFEYDMVSMGFAVDMGAIEDEVQAVRDSKAEKAALRKVAEERSSLRREFLREALDVMRNEIKRMDTEQVNKRAEELWSQWQEWKDGKQEEDNA